jgi:hypothetical protein|tara:strand:+ start:372 stop:560 length:189 start_codon:yes stop_codon:yes gene_type:complete
MKDKLKISVKRKFHLTDFVVLAMCITLVSCVAVVAEKYKEQQYMEWMAETGMCPYCWHPIEK